MFNFSCGFFCKDKPIETKQAILSTPPKSLSMSDDGAINKKIPLPVPASGNVRFFKTEQARYSQYMVVFPNTYLTGVPFDMQDQKAYRMYVVRPDNTNPYYSKEYNAYICPPQIPFIDVLAVSYPTNNIDMNMGAAGNIGANRITGISPDFTPMYCAGITNPEAFTNGRDAPPAFQNSLRM